MDESNFECCGVTIHFLYSFVLSDERKSGRILMDAKEVTKRYRDGKNPRAEDFGRDYPAGRHGIAPHLSLYSDAAWFQYPSLDGEIGEQPVKIERLARLFTTGSVCCISLKIPRAASQRISTAQIRTLLGLVEGRTNGEQPVPLKTWHADDGTAVKEDSIYDLFEALVLDLCENSDAVWFGKDPGDDPEKNPQQLFRSRKPTRVGGLTETQNPWVITVLDVDGETAEAFCGRPPAEENPAFEKLCRMKAYERDIAPILFRAVSKDFVLEPAYLDTVDVTGARGLANINLDANLFVQISRRSVLCISKNQELDPAKYFMPGLLDLCEMVRARWHALILMNKKLDWTLRRLRTISREDSLTKRRDILTIREWLATGLEDPATYVIAGDALTKLHRSMIDSTGLQGLQNMLLGKMDLLDRVYRDVLTMRLMDSED